MIFKPNDKIIMIGDSITDAGRRSDREQIGTGYFRLLRDYYISKYPDLNLTFINKGFDGNRVTDLLARWEEDVIGLNPDWVSISIGINDVWRQLDRPDMEQIYPEKFKSVYKILINEVKSKTDAKLILMEPTIIEEDLQSKGNQLLIPYVEIVRELAEEYHTAFVPTHESFIKFLQKKTGVPITTDGVHMTSTGDMLMATTWIDALQS